MCVRAVFGPLRLADDRGKGQHQLAEAAEDAPTAPAMPLLGWHLSDRQVAAVATFIRNSWGNAAGIVSEGDAARVRGKVASRTE